MGKETISKNKRENQQLYPPHLKMKSILVSVLVLLLVCASSTLVEGNSSSNTSGGVPMCRRHWGYFTKRQCQNLTGTKKEKCKSARVKRCQRCCGCGGYERPDENANQFNTKLFARDGKACS